MATPAAIRLALPLLCALTGCDDAADPWRELVADHVTTTGRVSRVDCGDVRYAFQAGTRTYAAQDSDGVLDCRSARIGDPVLVYYAPQDPDRNTLLPPAEARARALRWTLAGDAWLALVGAAAVVLSLAAKLWAARRSLA
jgi:Protein of unknown function (DUF3592)